MNIQGYPDELNYVNAKLHPLSPRCGSFLRAFLIACLRADYFNYELIRPALRAVMSKYPPDRLRIAMEQHDAGMEHEPLDPLLYPEFYGDRQERIDQLAKKLGDNDLVREPNDRGGEAKPKRAISV